MIPLPFAYNATVLEVHDGDTLIVDVDRGMYDRSTWVVRLTGLNTIEITAPGGVATRDYLRELLPLGTPVVLYTVKPDKYGSRKGDRRVVNSVVHYLDAEGVEQELHKTLIAGGWALAWNGRGTKPVPVWPRVKAG